MVREIFIWELWAAEAWGDVARAAPPQTRHKVCTSENLMATRKQVS